MRIAISGSHRTGKSTLLARLGEALPDHATVDEPYHLLQEEGYEFNDPPSLEDFEVQLLRSMEELDDVRENIIFDRCPFDFLAYIAALEEGERFELDDWLPQVRKAVQTLDLIVFLPIEEDDRMALLDDEEEDPDKLRVEVDGKLWELFLEDPYRFRVEYLEVEGPIDSRVEAVLERIRV